MALQNICTGACDYYLPPMLTGTRPHINDVVCRTHHGFIVLYYQYSIAQVFQPLQGPYQPGVISRVQSHRGLVTDIEYSHESTANLGCQSYPLRFPAAQRG